MKLLLFLIPALCVAQTNLTISSDTAAILELDGKEVGALRPGVPIEVQTSPGEHQLVVTPQGGGSPWRKLLLVSSSLPAQLSIPPRSHVLRAEIDKQGYWKDERTHLTWAASDSGSGVTVSQARAYCRELRAGGFEDWRLPSVVELQALFGGPPDERGFRVIAPLKLSGWAWSATPGNEPAENWTIDFGDGARASVAAGDAGLNRALCVR
jgi:Protein of unknown function (DUF1566)